MRLRKKNCLRKTLTHTEWYEAPFFGEWASAICSREPVCVLDRRGLVNLLRETELLRSSQLCSCQGLADYPHEICPWFRFLSWTLPSIIFFQICLCILKLTYKFYRFLIYNIFWFLCVCVCAFVCGNTYTPWNGSTELINICFSSHNYLCGEDS